MSWVPSGLSQEAVGAIVQERLDALNALREAIELADEGWDYASDYFVRKWDFIDRRNRLAAIVGMDPIGERRDGS